MKGSPNECLSSSVFSTTSFPVTLTAPTTPNLQINLLIGAVNSLFGTGTVMLKKCSDGLPIPLVVNACDKIMNAKETFVMITLTWNDWCPPHPIWFCTINVWPTVAYCMVHQLPRQIDLKPLPAILIQIHNT